MIRRLHGYPRVTDAVPVEGDDVADAVPNEKVGLPAFVLRCRLVVLVDEAILVEFVDDDVVGFAVGVGILVAVPVAVELTPGSPVPEGISWILPSLVEPICAWAIAISWLSRSNTAYALRRVGSPIEYPPSDTALSSVTTSKYKAQARVPSAKVYPSVAGSWFQREDIGTLIAGPVDPPNWRLMVAVLLSRVQSIQYEPSATTAPIPDARAVVIDLGKIIDDAPLSTLTGALIFEGERTEILPLMPVKLTEVRSTCKIFWISKSS
jgi:hypothetical protein